MAKEEPHWGEETCLPFSGTLPLGKAGLLLLCPGGGGTFCRRVIFWCPGGGGTFVVWVLGGWWPSILIFSIVQS